MNSNRVADAPSPHLLRGRSKIGCDVARDCGRAAGVPSRSTQEQVEPVRKLDDALATAIDETAESIDGRAGPDRPDNVIVVVLTDGKENASETPQQRVREMVTYRREEDDWEFFFIGANQDAALTAEGMGMASEKSLDMHHSGDGVKAAQQSTSRSISRGRRQGETGGYEEADRRRQDGADRK